MNLRIKQSFLLLPLLCGLVLQPATAQQSNVTRAAELGALVTTGNTDQQSLNFGVGYEIEQNRWDYLASLDGIYTNSDNEVKAQRFTLIGRANYELTEFSYFGVRASHEDDRFSGYDSQSDITGLYGQELLRGRADMNLDLDTGLGVRWSRLNGAVSEEAIARLAGEYEWIMSESASFFQDLSIDAGVDSTIYRSESAIQAQIMDNLSLRFSIRIRHQTEVPANRLNTDTETAVTFVMNF